MMLHRHFEQARIAEREAAKAKAEKPVVNTKTETAAAPAEAPVKRGRKKATK